MDFSKALEIAQRNGQIKVKTTCDRHGIDYWYVSPRYDQERDVVVLGDLELGGQFESIRDINSWKADCCILSATEFNQDILFAQFDDLIKECKEYGIFGEEFIKIIMG